MLVNAIALLASVAALASATAAPASAPHLVARECPERERPYVVLEGHSWLKAEALDKDAKDYWSDIGPFEREFAFYEPDSYQMEHFKLTTYKGDGEWQKDPQNKEVEGVFDCRISAVVGVPDIYCRARIDVWVGGDVYGGAGSIIPECVPWGEKFKLIPGYS